MIPYDQIPPAGGKERRQARIGALTGHQRDVLLSFLCGYVPQAVDKALDELGYDGPAAARDDRTPPR